MAEISAELQIPVETVQDIVQRSFIPLILQNLTKGRRVVIPKLGVLYPARARRPTQEGIYRTIPKFVASPAAKKILNSKGEKK